MPRRDLLEQQSHVAERVRKLEVMRVSRTLIPKRWKPHNPAADMAYGHMIRLLGLSPQTPALGPLPQRISPEVDYLVRSGAMPPLDDAFTFWLRTGWGPQYWLTNIPQHGGVFTFFTGSGAYERFWQTIGPDVDVLQPYVDGAVPAGGTVPMDTYPGLPLFGGSGPAVPPSGFYVDYKVTGDHREYQTPGMDAPAACQVPPAVDSKQPKGDSHEYTIPVQNAGCPDNPLDPQYSIGYEDAQYFTEDILRLQLVAAPIPVDLFGRGGLEGPGVPIRDPVSPFVLRDRIAVGLAEEWAASPASTSITPPSRRPVCSRPSASAGRRCRCFRRSGVASSAATTRGS